MKKRLPEQPLTWQTGKAMVLSRGDMDILIDAWHEAWVKAYRKTYKTQDDPLLKGLNDISPQVRKGAALQCVTVATNSTKEWKETYLKWVSDALAIEHDPGTWAVMEVAVKMIRDGMGKEL